MKAKGVLVIILMLGLLVGCGTSGGRTEAGGGQAAGNTANSAAAPYGGPESKAINIIFTNERELALTFNGMADKETMEQLLDVLDSCGIKATFFLPGMRVAEEPDIAQEIKSRGHEIENNTLNRVDLSKLTYAQTYNEIKLSGDVIAKKTGVIPHYVRTTSRDFTDQVRLAAAQSGHEAVIGSSLYLHNWHNETEEEKAKLVRTFIHHGGIFALDTEDRPDLNETVKLVADCVRKQEYAFVTLNQLMQDGE
ncbi:polysaccharide deacetylase family protein [Paenibacillus sp. R14(2021)]|uniref:polysaccharide deacetylase family protein n=1 Tax=Paenibacillus sp. R14(2021) TaxID=2859228 RepID=UPI001C615691|nr:polysaccharide deacetylase family protein [Paenibacillus sp. R14(2021)]